VTPLRVALRRGDDEGFGMILVIGMSAVVMSLVMVTGSIAMRSMSSARTHDSFASMLAVAETGIDQGIARVQAAYDWDGKDYRTPHLSATTFDPSPDCVASEDAYAFPSSAGVSNAAETAWAKAKLKAIAAIPGCLRTTSRGQYVILKPKGRQTVYAMGWSPKYVAGARSRMIKAEYIFAPYKPANAILTGGNLAIESSTTVGTVSGTVPADVHSNGNITVGGNAATVSGTVSMSGTGPLPTSGNFGGRAYSPPQSIPAVSALKTYQANVAKPEYTGAWWDLCKDGVVYPGNTAGTPCTGTSVGTYTGNNSFHNWKYVAGTPGTWIASGDISDGIYYVNEGNVTNKSGNFSANKVTIIASAQASATSCPKVGGNISWDHVDITVPYMQPGLFMLADQDLLMTANLKLGSSSGSVSSGSFIAGDQVELDTSSSTLYGSVIAADKCDPAGSLVDDNLIKNPSVFYDPNGYTPLTDVVNTTLWLELTG
jgi:hypothetical protein